MYEFSDMNQLYDTSKTYNQVPTTAPHGEITNHQLKLLYIFNIVLCLLTITLAINEVVINEDCVVCSDTSREVSYWFAIFALAAALVALSFNVFALATKSGFHRR